MIFILAFSNSSISTMLLCVAVNTSKGSDSFQFSICTVFTTIAMILFILVQSDITSSNHVNTGFEQVLVTFTFKYRIHPNLDNYLFLKTKILQAAIGKLEHYTTSGPSLYLSCLDPLIHHQLDYFWYQHNAIG